MAERILIAQRAQLSGGLYQRLVLALIAAAFSVSVMAPATADARDDNSVRYTIKSGDTLLGLAQKYFVSSNAYRRVQTINRISNPRSIPVGKVLRIPRNLLKSRPAQLSVLKFSGPVQISTRSGSAAPKVGNPVPEGAELFTGRGGFLSLKGAVGSSVSIPSQSQIRVLRARRILLTNTLDVEFKILKGRGSFSPPKLKRNGRYRVRTPVAVSAVRGTVFRVAFDEEGSRNLAEVLEGEVNLTAADTEAAIPEGFGTSASEAGVGELEELLPAPKLVDAATTQTDEKLSLAVIPVEGAKAYRIQLARDAGFIDLYSEVVSKTSSVVMDGTPNGRFHVRGMAISETGLEGIPGAFGDNFRRQRLGVKATAEASPLADGFKFAWTKEGEGEVRYDFQLWKQGQTSPPVINEIGLDKESITLTNLEPGKYEWRVAVVQPGAEEFLRVWGEPQKLVVAD